MCPVEPTATSPGRTGRAAMRGPAGRRRRNPASARRPHRGFPEVWGGWFRTLRLFPAQRHPDREPRCGGKRFNLHGEGGSPEPPRMAAPGGGRARPGPTRKRQRDTENRFASFPFTETPPLSVPRDETLSPAPALAQLDAGQARSARSVRPLGPRQRRPRAPPEIPVRTLSCDIHPARARPAWAALLPGGRRGS